MSVLIHTHTYTHMHTHMHAHTHAHTHMHSCTHMHIHMHMCTHTHTCRGEVGWGMTSQVCISQPLKSEQRTQYFRIQLADQRSEHKQQGEFATLKKNYAQRDR